MGIPPAGQEKPGTIAFGLLRFSPMNRQMLWEKVLGPDDILVDFLMAMTKEKTPRGKRVSGCLFFPGMVHLWIWQRCNT